MTKRIFSPMILRQTGILTLADLNANNKEQKLSEYGVHQALQALQNTVDIYNAQLNSALSALTNTTTARSFLSDVAGSFAMTDVDELGNVATSKAGSRYERALPLMRGQFAAGWSRDYEFRATVGEFATVNFAAMQASTRWAQDKLAFALYYPMERSIYEIPVDGNMSAAAESYLKVKPLYSADGEVPPMGPNGEQFDGDHTHYLATTSLTNAGVNDVIRTVVEHSSNADVELIINEMDVGTFQALEGFIAALPSGVIAGANERTIRESLDNQRTNNRIIGRTRTGYVVRTRPWARPGYAVAIDRNRKALSRRVPEAQEMRGLRLIGQEGNNALKTASWERTEGYGVNDRGAAAVLCFQAETEDVYETPEGI